MSGRLYNSGPGRMMDQGICRICDGRRESRVILLAVKGILAVLP